MNTFFFFFFSSSSFSFFHLFLIFFSSFSQLFLQRLKPLRMSVADVYKNQRLGPMTVSGRIQTGTLVVGDQVRVMPVYELCTVKAMSDHRGMPCKCAIAGTNVEIGLIGLDRYVSCVLDSWLPKKKLKI